MPGFDYSQNPKLPGETVLVYRYTVTGSDKASIDTGVDAPDAGSNDWTNGDVLDWYFMGRTDEAVVLSSIDFNYNNDTGNNYSFAFIDLNTSSVSGGGSHSGAAFQIISAGASAGANVAGMIHHRIPNYMGTAFYKIIESFNGTVNSTASSRNIDLEIWEYQSTSPITRLKIVPTTAGKKLKVGSQLLIYKRVAS
jgi:hypothetical protein